MQEILRAAPRLRCIHTDICLQHDAFLFTQLVNRAEEAGVEQIYVYYVGNPALFNTVMDFILRLNKQTRWLELICVAGPMRNRLVLQ